jgi:large subunit ribosomal protein L3
LTAESLVPVNGMLGRKLGMLQVFDEKGVVRGVTAIEAGPCVVTQVRTTETDGYEAVQVGFGRARRLTKPERGHLKGSEQVRYLREFKAAGDMPSVGDRVTVELFQPGDRIDVTATSKGRGFQGGVRRHGFHGGPKTHGQSDRHRAPGSIGAGTTPGKVLKGTKMAGHMGARRTTVRNLEIVQIHPERNILLVAGSVPGAPDGLVRIKRTTKKVRMTRR